jgi:hypothetical protein
LPSEPSPADLRPQLLYRIEAEQVRFATWGLTDGHEALAIFTSIDTATQYQADLTDGGSWTAYQPPPQELIEILRACRMAGILYAALDPIGGNAKTLFDIPRVLAAVDVGGESPV